MTGRIDSTLDRWRPSLVRSTALVAITALIAVGGATTTVAQGTAPRGKIQGVIPTAGTQDPRTANPPAQSELLPDLDKPPSSIPPPIPQPPPTGDPGPLTPGEIQRSKLDPKVKPTEAEVEDKDKGGLPTAIEGPGGPPSGALTPGLGNFALPPDRMSMGKQRVQVTVEVQASQIMNLNKETTVKLVVSNESNVDASGVSLVYQIPESLKLVSSIPAFTEVPGKPQVSWTKAMLAAGGDWVVVLKVVPITTKPAEHAATVTVKTGSRANSTIQEPKLKVEATSSPGRVLKGEQVKFEIAVQNPGTGPARNVIVRANLSSGLRCGSDDIVEQTIAEIAPGQRIPLEVLMVDTIAGGEQSCTVDVRSADVIPVPEDQTVKRTVEVTRPELTVKLDGQASRFTGQTNEYKLIVKNTGTAPAKKVRVVASLPQQGGKLIALPPGARFDLPTRKLLWSISQLEPDQTQEMTFNYGTSTPGLYRASVEVTSADLRATDTLLTDVSGIAVLDLQVTQTSRIMDVGKTNFYDITIKNAGTKEATKLLLKGRLAGKLKVLKTYGVDKGEVSFKAEGADAGQFLFPVIERLGVGQSITLSLEVQALESGPAGCHVFLAHSDMASEDDRVEDVVSTTVTGNGKSKAVVPK